MKWGVGQGQAGAERAGGWGHLRYWVGCRENRCLQQPFQWEQTRKVVVTPHCLIAMETWVVSKATSKAALPVALLDVHTEVCKPQRKGTCQASFWPLKQVTNQRKMLEPEINGENPSCWASKLLPGSNEEEGAGVSEEEFPPVLSWGRGVEDR